MVIFESQVLVCCNTTVERTFVGQSLTLQTVIIVMIDVTEMAPEVEKTLFEFAVVVFREVDEELLDNGFLLVCQIRYVVQLVNVSQIGKHLVGFSHVLVYVVEVC